MGRDATIPLLSALKQEFYHSGALDIIWSDQGPQFSSKVLVSPESEDFGISLQLTQSNGKVEVTVMFHEDHSCRMDGVYGWTLWKLARALLQYPYLPTSNPGHFVKFP